MKGQGAWICSGWFNRRAEELPSSVSPTRPKRKTRQARLSSTPSVVAMADEAVSFSERVLKELA